MRILAIDPGLACCGVAWYVDGTYGACSVRVKGQDLVERCKEIAYLVATGTPALWPQAQKWDLLVIEKMQVYQGSKQEGDPNDLINLSILTGMLFEKLRHFDCLLPLPVTWKGGVPKEIHHRRIREEVPGLGRQSKDAMDAVGLVLYGKGILDARSKKK